MRPAKNKLQKTMQFIISEVGGKKVNGYITKHSLHRQAF